MAAEQAWKRVDRWTLEGPGRVRVSTSQFSRFLQPDGDEVEHRSERAAARSRLLEEFLNREDHMDMRGIDIRTGEERTIEFEIGPTSPPGASVIFDRELRPGETVRVSELLTAEAKGVLEAAVAWMTPNPTPGATLGRLNTAVRAYMASLEPQPRYYVVVANDGQVVEHVVCDREGRHTQPRFDNEAQAIICAEALNAAERAK